MLNYQQMAAKLFCLKATVAGEYFPWMQRVYISRSLWNSLFDIIYKAFS